MKKEIGSLRVGTISPSSTSSTQCHHLYLWHGRNLFSPMAFCHDYRIASFHAGHLANLHGVMYVFHPAPLAPWQHWRSGQASGGDHRIHTSVDRFKGQWVNLLDRLGKTRISWEKPYFPVDVSLNQPIETIFIRFVKDAAPCCC